MNILLQNALKDIEYIRLQGDYISSIQIHQITADSRQVGKSSIFVAIKGTQSDGHQYINKAVDQGAVAIVCEEIPPQIHPQVLYVQVKNSAAALGNIAANCCGNPSKYLKVVGITGTNGKSTIATLLYHLYLQLGYKTGLISTIRYMVHRRESEATHTTPDAVTLQSLLAEMVAEGCEYCFMEVSSHAVVQQRIAGLHFTGAIFTNLSHDHLDFHKTFDEYLKAKKMFFDQLPATAFALSNIDDKRGNVMLQNTAAHCYTYALKSFADFRLRLVEQTLGSMVLEIDGKEVHTRLMGEFNAYNLLAVYASAVLLHSDPTEVLQALSLLQAAEGRFDFVVQRNRRIMGIVDYAHTPDALEKTLHAIQELRRHNGGNHIITVVGCGGDRDRSKRPKMAAIAASFSDKVILTSDNPRTESPQAILDDMKQGINSEHAHKTLSIENRREAIKTAVMLAQSGDMILVAGKGHEKYQEINHIKYPFDDKEELKQALALD
ncbi:MAG: UDP-N-acetylmuramoyl-L-alanyl-D-glutamate--2,6-diaminopimelate ligase [Sphingobacteriales bacterium]|nr:UDP-N-acetylmuramoyl-L-alanyl-D-glutamate--2,6-diaminopimelate ligase [Sphingobacteriales bacterium]